MPTKRLVFEKPTPDEVLAKITAFVLSDKLEERFAKTIASRKRLALKILRTLRETSVTRKSVVRCMRMDPDAIPVIISLLGLSQEEFYRLITLRRVLLDSYDSEWKMDKICAEVRSDNDVANMIASILVGGKKDAVLKKHVPSFTLNKLDPRKLQFDPSNTPAKAILDGLLRQGLKGRYDAQKGNVVQDQVGKILDDLGVSYEGHDISVNGIDRRMDFVAPRSDSPKVMIECGIFVTTARELSEKGLVEKRIRRQVEQLYPRAVLVRVLDGIGWLARGGKALANVMDGSHYVLTLTDLDNLEAIMKRHVNKKYFRSTLNDFS